MSILVEFLHFVNLLKPFSDNILAIFLYFILIKYLKIVILYCLIKLIILSILLKRGM